MESMYSDSLKNVYLAKGAFVPETSLSREITINRTYDTSLKNLFDFFKDPEKVAKWWGPDHFVTSEVEVEARVGGSYSLTMTGMGFSQRIIGTIVEYEEDRALAVENRVEHDGSIVLRSSFRVTIEETGEASTLTLVAKATIANEQMISALWGMYAGWNQSLQRLDDALVDRIDRTLVVLSGLDAPANEVFEYWTISEKLAKWWGPKGFATQISDMELSVGGGCSITMRSSEGEVFVNRITYKEIDAPKRLCFRHGLEGSEDPAFDVVVLFDEMGPQTVVSMRFIFDSKSDLDRTVNKFHAKQGAEESLSRLGEIFSTR